LAGSGCLDAPAYMAMSTPPITVRASESLWQAARVMYEAGVGSVIVVDEHGRVTGILTSRDILRLLALGVAARNPPVGDVMSVNVVTASRDESLGAIAERMREAGIRHVPIVDSEGRPLGIVTQTDLLRYLVDCLGKEGGTRTT
jgi:CBS domain-containing protein